MTSETPLNGSITRFINVMPMHSEKELILLKGHLLIEEMLTEVLRLTIDNDNPVGIKISDNMSFAQKLNLCWARHADKKSKQFWQGMKLLNSIRNKLAHNAQPSGLDNKILELIRLTSSSLGTPNYIENIDNHRFVLSLHVLYGELAIWIETINIQRHQTP